MDTQKIQGGGKPHAHIYIHTYHTSMQVWEFRKLGVLLGGPANEARPVFGSILGPPFMETTM